MKRAGDAILRESHIAKDGPPFKNKLQIIIKRIILIKKRSTTMSDFTINSKVTFGNYSHSCNISLSIDPHGTECSPKDYGEFGSIAKAALLFRVALISEQTLEADRALDAFKALVVTEAKETLRSECAAIDFLVPQIVITGSAKVLGATGDARTITFRHCSINAK